MEMANGHEAKPPVKARSRSRAELPEEAIVQRIEGMIGELKELAQRVQSSRRNAPPDKASTRRELEARVPSLLAEHGSLTVQELASLLGCHYKTAWRVADAVAREDGGVLAYERHRNTRRLRLYHPDAREALDRFRQRAS